MVNFKRNSRGQILSEQQGEHTIEYLYDKNENLENIISSLGADIKYSRDKKGLISAIRVGTEINSWSTNIKRNMLGLEIERSLPGGVKSSWSYDENNNPIEQKVENPKHKTGLHKNYQWNGNQQLQHITNLLTGTRSLFEYDAFNNLASAQYENGSYDYKLPDEIGNLFKSTDKTQEKYGIGGKLIQDKNWFYKYDEEGNLILKTKRNFSKKNSFWEETSEEKSTSSKKSNFWIEESQPETLYNTEFDLKPETRKYSKKELKEYDKQRQNQEELTSEFSEWKKGDWSYEWYANGMLKTVTNPDGEKIQFEYDALGRRSAKIVENSLGKDIIFRYLWDGDVLLHEWNYLKDNRPFLVSNTEGKLEYNHTEPTEELITWIYEEGSFVPTAKLIGDKQYSIISDYIGRPIQAYDSKGEIVWETDYSLYGDIRNTQGSKSFIPFRQLGQYEDEETGLYYNRFRYYNPETGVYLSKDPIGLEGNNPNLYAYVHDSNMMVDPFGLKLLKGLPLLDDTKVFRISDLPGVDALRFNSRELEAIASGRLNPPGVSLIRTNSAEGAMNIWNEAFPNRQIELSSVRGSTAAEIRGAGFDVIHDPSRGKIGDAHSRLIHPDGVRGFSDTNLEKISDKFKCP